MGVLDLFVASVIPVVKVLLITALGSFLAIDFVDILGLDARKHLNNVVFFVFNPALVGSNIAKYITLRSMAVLWFMPLNILITFIIGSILGWLLIRSSRAPHELWGLVLGCCSAGNLGNLPMIIIPAVCKEKGSPFGDVDICYTHGLAYASLSMAIGSIYMWSYVYNIVRFYSTNGSSAGAKLLPLNDMDQFEVDSTLPQISVMDRIKQGFRMVTKFNIRTLFAPSTAGAVVGFSIGTIPQLRKALIGENAPLHVLPDCASLVGDAAIPAITLVVGANLLKGLKGSAVQPQIIMGIVVVRYIILPICGVVIVKSAVQLGWVGSDPLYQFILLLQYDDTVIWSR
ncbi:protein PIN-LIKES 1-like isoform X2 [Mercurialis annua]|uniref:protein PIN-LIKES 1-like isoform X2 n=1 Tax=Mercurialis annua TaxID=3986 RepID=UPI00215E6EE8|nr:protein PIN-LIKES 1-like isoform X2 [Mercurialis annua]